MALENQPASGRRTILRLHCQKGLYKHPKDDPPLQHADLPTRPQPPKHHKLADDRQTLAQCAPTQGGHTHLADTKPGPPGGHLATTHGNHSNMQNL